MRFYLLFSALAVLISISIAFPVSPNDLTDSTVLAGQKASHDLAVSECYICYERIKESCRIYSCHQDKLCASCVRTLVDKKPDAPCPVCREPQSNLHIGIFVRQVVTNYDRPVPDPDTIRIENDDDRFVVSVIKNDTETFLKLLTTANVTYQKGAALKMAARFGRVDMIQPMLDKGLKPTIPFLIACAANQTRLVSFLLENTDVDPSYDYQKPLEFAAIRDNYNIIEMLVNNPRFNETMPGDVIQELAKLGKLDMVRYLLFNTPRYNRVPDVSAAFYWASTNLRPDIISTLLLDPDHFVEESNTPFIFAIYKNDIELVRILLEDGRYDPGYYSNGAIQEAALRNTTEIIDLLMMDSRVDPSDENNSALMNACSKGNMLIVMKLLNDLRVDTNANDGEPLRIARENGHQDIVELLLSIKS